MRKSELTCESDGIFGRFDHFCYTPSFPAYSLATVEVFSCFPGFLDERFFSRAQFERIVIFIGVNNGFPADVMKGRFSVIHPGDSHFGSFFSRHFVALHFDTCLGGIQGSLDAFTQVTVYLARHSCDSGDTAPRRELLTVRALFGTMFESRYRGGAGALIRISSCTALLPYTQAPAQTAALLTTHTLLASSSLVNLPSKQIH